MGSGPPGVAVGVGGLLGDGVADAGVAVALGGGGGVTVPVGDGGGSVAVSVVVVVGVAISVAVVDGVGGGVALAVIDRVGVAVAAAAVPVSVKSPHLNIPVYATAAPMATQKLGWPSPPDGILCAARATALVEIASGDDGRAVQGPVAPEFEYAIVAVAGPAAVRHKAVPLRLSAVKPVVSAQNAMPSFAALGVTNVPGVLVPCCVAKPFGTAE